MGLIGQIDRFGRNRPNRPIWVKSVDSGIIGDLGGSQNGPKSTWNHFFRVRDTFLTLESCFWAKKTKKKNSWFFRILGPKTAKSILRTWGGPQYGPKSTWNHFFRVRDTFLTLESCFWAKKTRKKNSWFFRILGPKTAKSILRTWGGPKTDPKAPETTFFGSGTLFWP
jgi:hypothetical protein